jgi:hypothetical protein
MPTDKPPLEYTHAVLAIVCPVCCAAITGKCLERTNIGLKYRSEPHEERVQQSAEGAAMIDHIY